MNLQLQSVMFFQHQQTTAPFQPPLPPGAVARKPPAEPVAQPKEEPCPPAPAPQKKHRNHR